MRADSPVPIVLHSSYHGRSPGEQAESVADEDDFPPSISQRRVNRSRCADSKSSKNTTFIKEGNSGLLDLPQERSSNSLKEKRSFERTKQWAEEAERSRRASTVELEDLRDLHDDLEEVLEGLVSDTCKCLERSSRQAQAVLFIPVYGLT